MIFILHFYSTAAIPYMGAQGGGGNSRRSPLSGKFFPCGFLFTLWGLFLHVVGLFPLGAISTGPFLHVGAFVLLRRGGGGGLAVGGDFWNCPSLNISLGALDTIPTVRTKLLH